MTSSSKPMWHIWIENARDYNTVFIYELNPHWTEIGQV